MVEPPKLTPKQLEELTPKQWEEFVGKCVLERARRGDPYPMIGVLTGRLQECGFSGDEIKFITDALRATAKKAGADYLRHVEQFLIASQVEGLVAEGMSQKAAIAKVMKHRNCSERHVFSAIKAARARKEV